MILFFSIAFLIWLAIFLFLFEWAIKSNHRWVNFAPLSWLILAPALFIQFGTWFGGCK